MPLGFNEKTCFIDKNRLGLNNIYYQGMKFTDIYVVSLIEKEEYLQLKPSSINVGSFKSYSLKVKNNTNELIKLQLKGTYNKETTKTFIEVLIKITDKSSFLTFDIIELFDGIENVINPFKELVIKLNYTHNLTKQSWQNAGRINIRRIDD